MQVWIDLDIGSKMCAHATNRCSLGVDKLSAFGSFCYRWDVDEAIRAMTNRASLNRLDLMQQIAMVHSSLPAISMSGSTFGVKRLNMLADKMIIR